jgi:hypothetical protein
MHRSRTVLAALAMTLLGAGAASAQSRDLQIIDMNTTTHSGIDTPQTRVITSMTDLRAFVSGTSIDLGVQPRVDFTTEDVLVACAGTKPNPGYGIAITKVTLMTSGFTGGHAFVTVTESRPQPGMMYPMVIVTPVHLVRVPKGAIAYHFTTAPTAPFTSLDLNVQSPAFGTSEQVVLQGDGRAQLLRSSPTARYAPVDGRATAAELQAVTDAFTAARVSTLPRTIADPNTYIVAPTGITLTSTVGQQSYTLGASLGIYGAYDARVRPLVDALRAIGRRLMGGFDQLHVAFTNGFAPWDQEVTIGNDGTVVVLRRARFSNPDQYFNGTASAADMDALRAAIANADMATLPATIDDPVLVMDVPQARWVTTLGGTDYTTVVTKSGFYGSYDARMKPLGEAVDTIVGKLVNPGASYITGKVTLSSRGYLYLDRHYIPWSDPMSGIVYRGVNKQVTVKATVQGSGSRTSLVLEAVVGTTTANLNMRVAPRTGNSRVIQIVPRGTQVDITALSRDRRWFNGVWSGEAGWMSSSYIRIGQ